MKPTEKLPVVPVKFFLVISLALCVSLFVLPILVLAESYQPLTAIPGLTSVDTTQGLGSFINYIYLGSIGIGAALSVVIFIFAGMQLATSASGAGRSKWKDRVSGALLGMLILVGAFVGLNTINTDLTKLTAAYNPISLSDSISQPVVETQYTTGVTNDEGKSIQELSKELEEMPKDEFIETFGREEFDKLPQAVREMDTIPVPQTLLPKVAQKQMDTIRTGLGTLFSGLTLDPNFSGGNGNQIGAAGTTGTPIPQGPIEVTTAGQKMILAAIKSGKCQTAKVGYVIPESWAQSKGLWHIIQQESRGTIGIVNYTIKEYAEANNLNLNQIKQDIKNDQFYSKHCCSSSNSCNALKRHNSRMARSQRAKYGHVAGKCTSAAGIGQLLITNMRQYQPGAASGFLDATSEICGMLNYIKKRYGDPTTAARRYVSGKGY